MTSLAELISILEEARRALGAPENDFAWSWWSDRDEAWRELDAILDELRSGTLPEPLTLRVLFAPTGPIQEVSISSGWGDAFIVLADRFDRALAACLADTAPAAVPAPDCLCLTEAGAGLRLVNALGMDDRFADVEVLTCDSCGRQWLRYHWENEGISRSGRWYLGVIDDRQAAGMTAEAARDTFSNLEWYFCGGSYFDGETARISGPIPPGS